MTDDQEPGTATRAAHWNNVYTDGGSAGVSWFQTKPTMSLELIEAMGPEHDVPVIDVGGGASVLVDHLLASGHTDVTVLDVSEVSLAEARTRIGDKPGAHWLVADLLGWSPTRQYGVWHDRAVLHFLVADADRATYREVLDAALAPGGIAVIGTFAPDGPEQCSGLPVRRHSPVDLAVLLGEDFTVEHEEHEIHTTPGGVTQSFAWVAARKANADVRRSFPAEEARGEDGAGDGPGGQDHPRPARH